MGREVGTAQPLGHLAQGHVARGVFRVEAGQSFAAGQGLILFLLLQEQFAGRGELFDGFRGAVVLLEQRAVAHQAFRGLGEGAEKTGEDGHGLGRVSGFQEPIKLCGVILGGSRGLVQAGVEIGQRLQGLLMGGHLGDHRLIFLGGLAEPALFQVAPPAFQMFVDVQSHANSCVLELRPEAAEESADESGPQAETLTI